MSARGTTTQHDDDEPMAGPDRERLIRLEERQREGLRRTTTLENSFGEHSAEATRLIEALGTAHKLLEFRVNAIDDRSKDSERVIRRLAWIVITWAAGLVLGAAAYVLKITGGGGALPHG